MSGLHYAEEDRQLRCGYPPSFARSQKIGTGTLDLNAVRQDSQESLPLFYAQNRVENGLWILIKYRQREL